MTKKKELYSFFLKSQKKSQKSEKFLDKFFVRAICLFEG